MRSTSFHQRFLFLLGFALLWAVAGWVNAGTLTVTPTGPVTISSATINGAWTNLPTLTYFETANKDIINGNLTLNAPPGYEFKTDVGIATLFSSTTTDSTENTNDLPVGAAFVMNRSATAFTITIFDPSKDNTRNRIRWTGLQIRPISAAAAGTKFVTISVPGFALTNAVELVMPTVTKLFTAWPGQTFTNGSGVTGTASPVFAGTAANMVLYATDSANNLVTSYAGQQTVSYTGPLSCSGSIPIYTVTANFFNGQATVPTTFFQAGATILTSTISGLTAVPSPSHTVGATAWRMLVTLPGQTFNACSGNSGTVSEQYTSSPFPVEVRQIDMYYNVTALSGNLSTTITGPTGTNSYTPSSISYSAGLGTVTATINTAQTATLTAKLNTPTVVDGLVSSPVTLTVLAEGFNAFDPSGGLPATPTTGVITTKRAGVAITLDIVARKLGGALSTAFSGDVKVELIDASGSGNCTSWPLITGATQTTTFSAGADKGRRSLLPFTVSKAYKRVSVRFTSLAGAPVPNCSIDYFAIRPDNFLLDVTNIVVAPAVQRSLVTTPSTSTTATHKAGQAMRVVVTARNATPALIDNYSATPTLVASSCATPIACPASVGTLSPGTWSGSAGVITSTTASYSDVGYLTITAQDTTFANVDLNDGSTEAQRFITGSATIGRFTPDHYQVDLVGYTNRVAASCSVANTSDFTYMGEGLQAIFKLTALNAANGPTLNYSGTYAGGGLVKLDPASSSFLNFGALDSTAPTPLLARITGITKANPAVVTTSQPHRLSTGTTVYLSGIGGMIQLNNTSWPVIVINATSFQLSGANTSTASFSPFSSGGSASRLAVTGLSASDWVSGVTTVTSTLSFSRQLAADGPFDAMSIGVYPIDTDAVVATGLDMNADGDSLPSVLDRVELFTTKMRFGRLAVRPAYGSQLLNLRVPVLAQYYNGTGFITNVDDDCTSLLPTQALLSDWTGGVSSTNLPQTNLLSVEAFKDGASYLTIAKPTNPVPTARGSALVEFNLGAAGANLPYLLGNWVPGGTYSTNPRARATFGNYGATPVIYTREVF